MGDGPFEQIVSALHGPLVVVTTASGGRQAGCLVGFHGQCGMDPPAYAVWLSKANRTYRIGALADTFAVHFLVEGQHDLAALFGGERGDEVDKLDRCSWTAGPDGVPLLDDCLNRFVGRRVALLDTGADHVCVVLEPTSAEAAADPGRWLTIDDVGDVDAGHAPQERQTPR